MNILYKYFVIYERLQKYIIIINEFVSVYFIKLIHFSVVPRYNAISKLLNFLWTFFYAINVFRV